MADNLPSASKMTEKSRIVVFIIIIITIISIVSGTVVLLRGGALYRPQWLGFLGIQRWFSAPYIYLILNSVIISIAASPTISHSMLRILNCVTQRGYGIHKRSTPVGRGASQLLVSPSAAATTTTTATTFSHDHFDQTWQDLIQDLTPPSLSPPLEVGEPIAKLWPVVYRDGTHVVQTMESPSNGREAMGGAKHVENMVDRGEPVSPLSTIANEENSMDSFQDEDGDETLEGTWRAIMGKGEAASPPSSMSFSESERIIVSSRLTSPRLPRPRLPRQDALSAWRELRKSETFNEAVSARQRGGLRRDPSLSVEDLNGRVETFIKNFNREMWLQRQESDQRFLEMINSGA